MLEYSRIGTKSGGKRGGSYASDAVTSAIGSFSQFDMSKIVPNSFREADDTILIYHIDLPSIQYRTLFVNAGVHFNPDSTQNIVMHIHPPMVRSVNSEFPVPGVALVIPNNTNIVQWVQQSRELTTISVNATSAPDNSEQIALTKDGKHGVGVTDDGTFIAHSPGGTIVGGQAGLYIAGKQVILATDGTKQYGIFQEPPSVLKYLPSLFFFPNPSMWPDSSLVSNIGGVVSAAGAVLGG